MLQSMEIWKYFSGSGLKILFVQWEEATHLEVLALQLQLQLQKEATCMCLSGFGLWFLVIGLWLLALQQLKEVIY